MRVEIALRPFELTIRRAGRRLVRSLGAWVADGTVHDHFIQFTEGVVAREELAPVERAAVARVQRLRARPGDAGALAERRPARAARGPRARRRAGVLRARAGGRAAAGRARLAPARRRAVRRPRRAPRHAVRPGGRVVQLGADRRYTGPDCPADLLAGGGIPQGDCAPVPWFVSSRGLRRLGQIGGERDSVRLRRRPRVGLDSLSARARCGSTSCAIRRRRRGCGRSAG